MGTHKLSKCTGMGTKKEGKCPAPGIGIEETEDLLLVAMLAPGGLKDQTE